MEVWSRWFSFSIWVDFFHFKTQRQLDPGNRTSPRGHKLTIDLWNNGFLGWPNALTFFCWFKPPKKLVVVFFCWGQICCFWESLFKKNMFFFEGGWLSKFDLRRSWKVGQGKATLLLDDGNDRLVRPITIVSMGVAYLPTWMVNLHGKLVGKSTSPMDGIYIYIYIYSIYFHHIFAAKTLTWWEYAEAPGVVDLPRLGCIEYSAILLLHRVKSCCNYTSCVSETIFCLIHPKVLGFLKFLSFTKATTKNQLETFRGGIMVYPKSPVFLVLQPGISLIPSTHFRIVWNLWSWLLLRSLPIIPCLSLQESH